MLLTVDLDEDFIDVEGVAVTSMFSLQPTSINSSEFDTPETNCFAADSDSSFGEEVFNIAMAQVETIVEPDSVRNEVGGPCMYSSPDYRMRGLNLPIPFLCLCCVDRLNPQDITDIIAVFALPLAHCNQTLMHTSFRRNRLRLDYHCL
jgi:hypothetical protein